MAADTESDHDGLGFDQYWRRRAVALGGLLGVVGLMAWACTAGGGDDKQPVRNASAVGTAGSSAAAALPTAMPTVTVTAQVTATPAPVKKDGDACESRDVVVNAAITRDVYAKGESPQMQITVVNTGTRACTLDVGANALDVRITSGSDRVWSSARCARGNGASIQMLRRGIPYVGTVTWDRLRSGENCRGEREKARPGTYVATVKSAKFKVKKQVFALR
ncbi:hypothetical protein [Actinomadura hibisca]|uniref:hypothetical protein n=1 Tax=Actinomadura hibisca TaxID=68565 RepID=UPI00082E9707|nr:hypothetical protein [Actinomadura hibisca]